LITLTTDFIAAFTVNIFLGFRIQEIAEAFSHLEGDVVASIPMPEKVKKYVEKKLRLPM
jgi:hypothetical protein